MPTLGESPFHPKPVQQVIALLKQKRRKYERAGAACHGVRVVLF